MIDGGAHVSHIDTLPGWSAIGHIGLGDAVEERRLPHGDSSLTLGA